ncbi:MAG: hypothetical protein IGR92_13895 [Leptolyngbyaceae cyanobacterium T60_A2020_046]|nr:hypothetical protein [Leptolyngbyaceae cyanobacterium T60_A2020_046]
MLNELAYSEQVRLLTQMLTPILKNSPSDALFFGALTDNEHSVWIPYSFFGGFPHDECSN